MKNRTIGYLCNGKRCDYCESRMHPDEKHNCRHTTDKKYAKYRFRFNLANCIKELLPLKRNMSILPNATRRGCGSMKLIELLPLIDYSTVNIYEKRRYRPSSFITTINPKKNKGYISNNLLDGEIYSISTNCNGTFNVFIGNKKADEELVDFAISQGLVNKDEVK